MLREGGASSNRKLCGRFADLVITGSPAFAGDDNSLWRRRLHLPLDQGAFDLGDGLGRVEVFWAGLGAIHDGVAAVQAKRVFQIVEPLAGGFVARIYDPA